MENHFGGNEGGPNDQNYGLFPPFKCVYFRGFALDSYSEQTYFIYNKTYIDIIKYRFVKNVFGEK